MGDPCPIITPCVAIKELGRRGRKEAQVGIWAIQGSELIAIRTRGVLRGLRGGCKFRVTSPITLSFWQGCGVLVRSTSTTCCAETSGLKSPIEFVVNAKKQNRRLSTKTKKLTFEKMQFGVAFGV